MEFILILIRDLSDLFKNRNMQNEKLIQKIKELAERIKYGNATIEFTFSRGEIVKATIKESQEVVLI